MCASVCVGVYVGMCVCVCKCCTQSRMVKIHLHNAYWYTGIRVSTSVKSSNENKTALI